MEREWERERNLWNKIKNDTQHERTITNCITISQSHVDFTCYAMWCAQKKYIADTRTYMQYVFVLLKLILFSFIFSPLFLLPLFSMHKWQISGGVKEKEKEVVKKEMKFCKPRG